MVDRDVLARIMRAVEEVERRKGLSVPPSLNSVYASEGGGWPGVTTDDGELVRMPSRLDLDYGTKMPPMMLPSDFERVMAPIYPGFRPVHGAGDSGGNERSDDAPKASAALAAAGPAASSASTVTAAGASSVPSSSSSTLPDASSSMTSMGGGDPDNFKHTQEDYDLVEELGLKDLVDDELQGLTGDDYNKRWDDLKTMMLTAREFPDSQEAVALESKNAERFIRSLIGAVAGSARTVMGAVAGGIAGRIAPEMMTLGAKIDEDKRAEAMKKILDSIPRFGNPTTFADDVRSAVINMELQGLTGGDTSTTISEIYRIRDLIDKNKDSHLRYKLAADLVYKVEVMTTPGNVLLSLYEGGKAVPAKVASWVRESVGSCASGVGKTLKRVEMARVVAAMYPDLPAEFLQKAAKPSLCLLLGDEIVGRTISGLCRQGLAGGPDTQRRLIEIVSTLTQQPAASLVALSREALCSLAANASSTKQRAGAMHAAKLLDPLAGVDWSKVGAQASSALSAAARGGRAAFDASKVIGEQLYDGTNAVLQSPVTRAAARMAGQAAMAGGRMAGQAAMAGGRMAGRAAMDMVAPPPFEIHGVTQHRAYQVALDSAHRMRSDRIASAMNPYTGVEKGKAPKASRAMRRDGNPYVGYGNAGYLGSKRTSTAAAAAARGGSGGARLVRGLGIGLGRGRRIGSGSGASGSGGGGGGGVSGSGSSVRVGARVRAFVAAGGTAAARAFRTGSDWASVQVAAAQAALRAGATVAQASRVAAFVASNLAKSVRADAVGEDDAERNLAEELVVGSVPNRSTRADGRGASARDRLKRGLAMTSAVVVPRIKRAQERGKAAASALAERGQVAASALIKDARSEMKELEGLIQAANGKKKAARLKALRSNLKKDADELQDLINVVSDRRESLSKLQKSGTRIGALLYLAENVYNKKGGDVTTADIESKITDVTEADQVFIKSFLDFKKLEIELAKQKQKVHADMEKLGMEDLGPNERSDRPAPAGGVPEASLSEAALDHENILGAANTSANAMKIHLTTGDASGSGAVKEDPIESDSGEHGSTQKRYARSGHTKKHRPASSTVKRKHRAKSAPSSGSSSRQRCSHSLGANAVLCA
eukprot:jgi/Mesvir1/1123/Mv17630-RA.1